MQISGGDELVGIGAAAGGVGSGRGGAGGGIASESGLGGGDADGVCEVLKTELVEESSSSRNAVSRGRFEDGGATISSSSPSESNVMQSTVLSAEDMAVVRLAPLLVLGTAVGSQSSSSTSNVSTFE